jgi:hypothetical protein
MVGRGIRDSAYSWFRLVDVRSAASKEVVQAGVAAFRHVALGPDRPVGHLGSGQ